MVLVLVSVNSTYSDKKEEKGEKHEEGSECCEGARCGTIFQAS
jgi:hypothetical protein